MIVTYHSLIVDRRLVASGDRDELLTVTRQTFDELGMRIHKQDSSQMVHWPGGLGRATHVSAFLTNTPASFYRVAFESIGVPSVTAVHIAIKLVYGRWFHGREKAQAKIDTFLKKLHDVSRERAIRYLDRKEYEASLIK
jgi:hypothetical protein